MAEQKGNINYIRFLLLILIFLSCFLLLINSTLRIPKCKLKTAFARTSSDAIAIRIIPNPEYYSALRWYREQGFTGSPQSLTIDGYEAVRDGRTVYVNAGNVVGSELHINIYLISYNQEAESATIDIFSQILAHWKFNTNLAQGETMAGLPAECSEDSTIQCISDEDCLDKGYCNSAKSQVTRDTIRLARMTDIDLLLSAYAQATGHYPTLAAGTYLPHITISVWPSWQKLLAQELKSTLPLDPINKLTDCGGSNFHPITCWDEGNKTFAWPNQIQNGTLPAGNYVFLYQTDDLGANYKLCAFDETGMINPAKSCRSDCIPYCFNKECGDDNCGGSCLPGCGPTETCQDGACYPGCNTQPGCRDSLANAHLATGHCLSGYCWQCNLDYNWDGSICAPAPCTVTCITGPGCRTSLANGQIVSGECCDSGSCYQCAAGYSWNGSICAPAPCTVTCNVPNQPNCQTIAPANSRSVLGECCGSGSCYQCEDDFLWDGNNCYCPTVQINPVSDATIHTCPAGACPPVSNVYHPVSLFLPAGVATNEPVVYSLTGNPIWLVIHPTTGYIQGTPINPENYVITVTATNKCGNSDSTNFTLTVPPNEWCGDVITQTDFGEDCDDGADGDNTDQCYDDCTKTYCGDGIEQNPNGDGISEECDDGNSIDGDGCNSSCIIEFCGDNIIQSGLGEECDEGGSNGLVCVANYGETCNYCSDICTMIEIIGPSCGDGNINGVEECDDGVNGDDTDQCYDDCTKTYCGDGIIQNPNGDGINEECDGADLGGQTCAGLGFDGGTLICVGNCTYDLANCCPTNIASIQTCADNAHTTYFNGVFVSQAADWSSVQAFNVTVQPGKNVIAFAATDWGALYGVSLTLNRANCNNMTTNNLAGWKCTASPGAGWTAIGYDDSSWPSAVWGNPGTPGIRPGNYLSGIRQIWASGTGCCTTVYCRYSFWY